MIYIYSTRWTREMHIFMLWYEQYSNSVLFISSSFPVSSHLLKFAGRIQFGTVLPELQGIFHPTKRRRKKTYTTENKTKRNGH